MAMPLIDKILLLPLFIHVLLVFYLGVRMFRARVAAVQAKETKIADIALDNSKWPERIIKLQQALNNQFETPPLFIFVVILALVLGLKSWIFVALAWVYMATRLIHSYIRITTNHVPRRARAYGAGLLILLAMWLYLFVHIFLL